MSAKSVRTGAVDGTEAVWLATGGESVEVRFHLNITSCPAALLLQVEGAYESRIRWVR